jgi:hypothetical protein
MLLAVYGAELLKHILAKIAVVLVVIISALVLCPDVVKQLSNSFVASMDRFLSSFSLKAGRIIPGFNLSKEMIIAIFCWIILALMIFAGVSWFLKKRKTRLEKHETPVPEIIETKEEPSKEVVDFTKGSDFNREVVVRFFLKIFKIQIGAMKSAPGKYQPVTTINVWPNRVYELSVLYEGEWVTRQIGRAHV